MRTKRGDEVWDKVLGERDLSAAARRAKGEAHTVSVCLWVISNKDVVREGSLDEMAGGHEADCSVIYLHVCNRWHREVCVDQKSRNGTALNQLLEMFAVCGSGVADQQAVTAGPLN